jgi:hypothetical protein
MNYPELKAKSLAFIQEHHSYCWGVLEFSMICAGLYSVFGLILFSTAALASGNTLLMMVEFMIAPVYATILFIAVTAALSIMLTLPYAIALGFRIPNQQTAKVTASTPKKPRSRKTTSSRRAAKA